MATRWHRSSETPVRATELRCRKDECGSRCFTSSSPSKHRRREILQRTNQDKKRDAGTQFFVSICGGIKLRSSTSEMLSDAQVAQIERRRKALLVSRSVFCERFAAALKGLGGNQTAESAKKRLDRVINPRMRRPLSDETKTALATALDWTVEEFETRISGVAAAGVSAVGRGACHRSLIALAQTTKATLAASPRLGQNETTELKFEIAGAIRMLHSAAADLRRGCARPRPLS